MPFWESSLFWGIAGIVAGFVVATFFFLIGKNKKILEYQVTSTNLITKDMAEIPGINITLDGQPVANLISSTVKFMNAGNQTIVPDDFATLEPLGIGVEKHLLSLQHGYHISSDNPNSCPLIKAIDDKTINIEFDFLKPKQSFLVTVLHDGDISIFGELKAGKTREFRDKSLWISIVLGVLIGVMGIFTGLLFAFLEPYRERVDVDPFVVAIAALLFVCIISFVLVSINKGVSKNGSSKKAKIRIRGKSK